MSRKDPDGLFGRTPRADRRAEVVRYARLMAARGYVVGADGNVSVRDSSGRVLITPSAVAYESLRPAQVRRIALDGSGDEGASSEWRVHAAIYAARPDVEAVIHAHPIHATVLAVNRRALPALLDEMGPVLGGPVEVAEYAPSGSVELAEAIVTALAGRQAALIANHGTVSVGRDLAQAFHGLELLERAAHVFLLARQAGEPFLLDG